MVTKSKFRSVIDPTVGNIPRGKFTQKSMVDASQYESTSQTIARVLRGQPVAQSMVVDEADVLEGEVPLFRKKGFDISDVSETIRKGEKAVSDLNKAGAERKTRLSAKKTSPEGNKPDGESV